MTTRPPLHFEGVGVGSIAGWGKRPKVESASPFCVSNLMLSLFVICHAFIPYFIISVPLVAA